MTRCSTLLLFIVRVRQCVCGNIVLLLLLLACETRFLLDKDSDAFLWLLFLCFSQSAFRQRWLLLLLLLLLIHGICVYVFQPKFLVLKYLLYVYIERRGNGEGGW